MLNLVNELQAVLNLNNPIGNIDDGDNGEEVEEVRNTFEVTRRVDKLLMGFDSVYTPNLKLNPMNGCAPRFAFFTGRQKIIIEHERRTARNCSAQVGLYLYKGVFNDKWKPARPFNLPSFTFHSVSNRLLVLPPFGDVQELPIPLDYVNEAIKANIYNHRVEFRRGNSMTPFNVVNFGPQYENFGFTSKNYPNEDVESGNTGQDASIKFLGQMIGLIDKHIVDMGSKKPVRVYLSNQYLETHTFKKVAFHSTQYKEEAQVMALLDSSIMVAGIMRRKTGIVPVELICDLTEIPASYGTSGFGCSPDFNSMLRVSHSIRKEAPGEILPGILATETERCKNGLVELGMERIETIRQNPNKRATRLMHNCGDEFLESACKRTCLLLFLHQKMMDNELHGGAMLSPREKLHLTLHNDGKHVLNAHQSFCNQINPTYVHECFSIPRFWDICSTFFQQGPPSEMKLEFGKLLLVGYSALNEFLLDENINPTPETRTFILNSLWIPSLYRCPISEMLPAFESEGIYPPSVCNQARGLILEIFCKNAMPGQYPQIVNLLKSRSPYEGARVKSAVRKALVAFPHITLFGREPTDLDDAVLEQIGRKLDVYYRDTTIVETISSDDDDDDDDNDGKKRKTSQPPVITLDASKDDGGPSSTKKMRIEGGTSSAVLQQNATPAGPQAPQTFCLRTPNRASSDQPALQQNMTPAGPQAPEVPVVHSRAANHVDTSPGTSGSAPHQQPQTPPQSPQRRVTRSAAKRRLLAPPAP